MLVPLLLLEGTRSILKMGCTSFSTTRSLLPALEELSWLLITTMRLDDAVAAAGSSLPPEWEPELSLRGASASPDSPATAAASADPGF